MKGINNEYSQSLTQNQDKKTKMLKASFFVLLTVAVVMTIPLFFQKPTNPTKKETGAKISPAGVSPADSKSDTGKPPQNIANYTYIPSRNGFLLPVPDGFLSRWSSNSDLKFSIDFVNWNQLELSANAAIPSDYLQIHIESYPEGSDTYKNSFLSPESKTSKTLGDKKFDVTSGKENISTYPREYEEYRYSQNGQTVIVLAYSPSLVKYRALIEEAAGKIHFPGNKKTGSVTQPFFKFGLVLAEESGITYSPIEVMAEPFADKFESTDHHINGHPVRGYVFQAIQGQRLTTVAENSRNDQRIKTSLYDDTNHLVLGPQDTRIEFTASYSGPYYLTVTDESGLYGIPFNVEVEDRDLTDFTVKVKDLQTGFEMYFPHEKGLREIPFQRFALLIDYNKNADPSKQPPSVFALSGTVSGFSANAFFPEDDEKNKLKIKTMTVDEDSVWVLPSEDGNKITAFPDKSQLVVKIPLSETANYLDRSFTNFKEVDLESGDSNYIPPSGTRKVLVMMYNFQDNSNSKPFTKEKVADRFFGDQDSLKDYFEKNSRGRLTVAGDVTDWMTIPMDSGPGCVGNNSLVIAEARKAGLNPDAYQHLVFLRPYRTACGFGGSGSTGGNPGTITLEEDIDLRVITHELGHNLTLGHAHSLRCEGKSVDNYSNCTVNYYGDHYSVMGWSGGDLAAYSKNYLGWLPDANIETIGESGSYTISPHENISGEIQMYKIHKKDTNEDYFIEYRQPQGYDRNLPTSAFDGLTIRIAYFLPYVINTDVYNTPESYLLDLDLQDPQSETLKDNKSFMDEANGITITQTGHSSDSARFTVTFRE